jgi:RES domain
MSTFESKNAYSDFAKTVQTERRFIFDGKAGNFLAAVRRSSKLRARTLKSGSQLFRAQLGSDFAPWRRGDGEDETGIDEEHPLQEDRMIPDPKFIKFPGRANPPGFAYLYLANNPGTALAEMRPWVGESLTIAVFEIQKDIKLVACQEQAENLGERILEENPPAEKVELYVWNDISRAFARPVNREDQESAYIPTQILAEAFKAEGFDGLAYQSSLSRGTNLALFDKQVAKLVHSGVYSLKKVRYDFEAVPNYGIYLKKPEGREYLGEIHTESPD